MINRIKHRQQMQRSFLSAYRCSKSNQKCFPNLRLNRIFSMHLPEPKRSQPSQSHVLSPCWLTCFTNCKVLRFFLLACMHRAHFLSAFHHHRNFCYQSKDLKDCLQVWKYPAARHVLKIKKFLVSRRSWH